MPPKVSKDSVELKAKSGETAAGELLLLLAAGPARERAATAEAAVCETEGMLLCEAAV